MSLSVMVARTRIWRTMVAIIRGGNFWGAAWQRPQFAWNRRSPSTRMVSASAALRTTGALVLTLLPDEAAPHTAEASTKSPISNRIFIFIGDFPAPMGKQNGMQGPLSKGWHFHPE